MRGSIARKTKTLRVALELPSTALSDTDKRPRLVINITLLEVGNYQPELTFLRKVATRAGIYASNDPKEIVEDQSIFRRERAADLLKGSYTDRDWLPYSFTATPTTLRFDYYHATNLGQRGFIELGRNFHQLNVTVSVLDGQAQVSLESEGVDLLCLPPQKFDETKDDPIQSWDLRLLRALSYESPWLGLSSKRLVEGMLSVNRTSKQQPPKRLWCCQLYGKDYDPAHLDII